VLFFQTSKLTIDGTHRISDFIFTFLTRHLRILARKLPVLTCQIGNQGIQFGCGKSHVVSYTAFSGCPAEPIGQDVCGPTP